MRIRCVFLAVSALGMGSASFGQYISPAESGSRIDMVAPTTRPWYEPDDSLDSLNAGFCFGNSAVMIRIMKEGLIGKQCPLASTSLGTRKYITEISDALYRSGDSPEITNTLHQSLLTPNNLYRDIILPQAVPLMLPPLGGVLVNLVKHSAIVSVIAVYDLTTQARTVISDTFMAFEIWLTTAAMYLVITITLSLFVNWLENRYRRP